MHSLIRNAAAWGGFLVLTAGVFSLGLGGQRKADAFPAYSKKEGKPCSFCHVNANGGGKNNATGKWYKAHSLSLVDYTPEKAAAEFGGAVGAAVPAGTTPPAGAAGMAAPKPSPKPAAKPAVKKSAVKKTKGAAKPAPKK